MVALVAGMAIFALAWVSRPWAARLLGAAWVLACLAVLPIALLAGRGHLDKVPWLHHSLQHRFVIWNYTAEETLKAPVLGIGAYMTYVLGPERNKTAVKAPGEQYKKTLSRHAHNVYLQTWYELGAVGAALLMAFGLDILAAIRRMSEHVQPFALATFATAATMISSSYGMWQTWYLALFAFAAVALAVGVKRRAIRRIRRERACRAVARAAKARLALRFVVAAFSRCAGEGWCCRVGLNYRPLPYQGSALPLSYGSRPGEALRQSGSLMANPQESVKRRDTATSSLGWASAFPACNSPPQEARTSWTARVRMAAPAANAASSRRPARGGAARQPQEAQGSGARPRRHAVAGRRRNRAQTSR